MVYGTVQVHPRQSMRAHRGTTLSLASALVRVGGQRHTSTALTPGKKPGTHCIGGWVGPRARLEMCVKSRLHRDSIPGTSSL